MKRWDVTVRIVVVVVVVLPPLPFMVTDFLVFVIGEPPLLGELRLGLCIR